MLHESLSTPPLPERSNPFKEEKNDRERFELFFDTFLNNLLEQHAKKINEGNNGIIFRLDIQSIDPKVLEVLRQHGIDFGSEQAAKVLRFGKPGQGKKEFQLHSSAYTLLEKKGPQEEIARIPRPIVCREIEISKNTHHHLEAAGVRVQGSRVEVQIMDIVHGEDLATILYKEVIRHHPSTVHLVSGLDTFTFSELHEAVAEALGFALPGKKARDGEERVFEEQKVLAMNAEKIYRFLAHKNIRFHPSISRQIRGCMQVLHDGGIAHRDAHHRNVMIQGDYRIHDKEAPKVWIIDFGAAVEFSGNYSQVISSEKGSSGQTQKYIDDDLVAHDLEANLSKSFEQHVSEEQRARLKELSSLRKKLLRSSIGQAHLKQAKQLNSTSNLDLLLTRSPNPKLATFLVLLQEGVSQETLSKENVSAFLSQKKRTLIPADAHLVDTFLAALKAV